MGFVVENVSFSIRVSLTALKCVGFWPPESLTGNKRLLYNCYAFFCVMYVLGTYIIIQLVDLFQIWGDLPLMTSTAFLLFTNFAHVTKFVNILARRQRIQAIISDAHEDLKSETSEEGKDIVQRCNFETKLQQMVYFFITGITLMGWASSAEKGKLPLRAWYPYDTSKSPAYEITYVHQVSAVFVAGFLNVAKDSLVTALIAQCRCRLVLLGLSLRTLCDDMTVSGERLMTPEQEKVVGHRLRRCVQRHQAALEAALQLQSCFSEPTFAQFTVSLVIICATAFQMISRLVTSEQEKVVGHRLRRCVQRHQAALEAGLPLLSCFSEPTLAQFTVSLVIICATAFQMISLTGNLVRLLSMGTYLMNMMLQVFIYCYQGNQLAEESVEVARAAYEVPWYACSVRVRRSVLVITTRCQRVVRLTAGGFTTLSLASFMAIIKASYSLFTLLKQVEEKN